MEYIKIQDCENRHLYKLNSRNLTYGIFEEDEKGFVGIREKFGDEYLFTEYHWDIGEPIGTVHPVKKLIKLPDDIMLSEYIKTIDKKTGREVTFDYPISTGGRGWCFVDTDTPSADIKPTTVKNDKLFQWLKTNSKDIDSEKDTL